MFVKPDILIVWKHMGFIGKILQDFCPSRNIVLNTVIPGRRESLGATERRRGHFRTTVDHIVGNRKSNCLMNKEWGEFPSMAMAHLNPQVQQLDGLTSAERVFCRGPKLPIGAVCNPHFRISRIRRSRPRSKHIAYFG